MLTEEEVVKFNEKLDMLDRVMGLHKKCFGERLVKTRELFESEILIGDIHSHSLHSDGRCSVDELKKYADLANLDFFFVTDHDSLQQSADCKKYKNAWVGQEPGCAAHHIGVLSPSSLFVPGCVDFLADWRIAKKLSAFTWVPHPTGWFPHTYYNQEQMDELLKINEKFAIEILNGSFKMTDVFDSWQENNIALWDRLLCAGKRVIPIGGSDAHFAAAIGCAWTGLFDTALTQETVLAGLNEGSTIVSEGPMLKLLINGVKHGGELILSGKKKLEFKIIVADSLGVSSVRLIKDGQINMVTSGNGQKKLELNFQEIYKGQIYYRLECISVDYKHAFSSPIYLVA